VIHQPVQINQKRAVVRDDVNQGCSPPKGGHVNEEKPNRSSLRINYGQPEREEDRPRALSPFPTAAIRALK